MPGVLHDICSAIHPFGVGSPYLSSLPLAEHGLVWRWPEIDLAHPLDDGSAAVMVQSIDETAAGLGADGDRWRGVFGPLVEPLRHALARRARTDRRTCRDTRSARRGSACAAALPANVLARRFTTDAGPRPLRRLRRPHLPPAGPPARPRPSARC